MRRVWLGVLLFSFMFVGCSSNRLETRIRELEDALQIKDIELVERSKNENSIEQQIKELECAIDESSQRQSDLEENLAEKLDEIDQLKTELKTSQDVIIELEEKEDPDSLFIKEMVPFLSMDILGYNRVYYISEEEKYNYSIMLNDSLYLLNEGSLGWYTRRGYIEDNIYIRSLYEREYFLYKQDGSIHIAKGEFGSESTEYYNIHLIDMTEPGVFMTHKGDYIPRDVDVHVWFDENYNEYEVCSDNKFDFGLVSERLGYDGLDLVQYYTCDLNGDGTLETIVNFNNSFRNSDYISDNFYEVDFSKVGFESKILILNDEYEVICNLLTADIDNNSEVGNLFATIQMIFDFNEDGQFEILVTEPVWEGAYYHIYYFDESFNIINDELFYTGQ